MAIKHHLSDELLLAYAAGTLGEGWSVAVASHLSLCPVCRARETQLAALGGAALLDMEQADMSAGALEHCLAAIDTADRPAESVPPVPHNPVLPAPLRAFVGGDADSIRWSMVGGGVRQHRIAVKGNHTARLLKIAPGESVPPHSHRGMELTMVLTGSFSDESDLFQRGDVELADDEVEHAPVAGYGEPCLCLAITDAPLRFQGLVPKIVQRFVGI